MSIVRVGSNKLFADGWESAFSGKKKSATPAGKKATAKKSPAKKVVAKKSAPKKKAKRSK